MLAKEERAMLDREKRGVRWQLQSLNLSLIEASIGIQLLEQSFWRPVMILMHAKSWISKAKKCLINEMPAESEGYCSAILLASKLMEE